MDKPPISFVGGGNMAGSLIGGLITRGYPAALIAASDPLEQSRQSLSDRFGIRVTADNNEVVKNAALVVLAVKPQVLKAVAAGVRQALGHSPVIVSIAAGVNLASLQSWLGDDLPVIRCMPNTPALVQTGAIGVFANARVSDAQRQLCEEILSAVGLVEWVASETDIDAVTAVSGSGPAYYFLVMEIMERVAVEMGLPRETARALTLQTALGAAKMASASQVDAAELRRGVTSPNGTTERAINTLISGNIEALFRQAMLDCRERAIEMAEELQDP